MKTLASLTILSMLYSYSRAVATADFVSNPALQTIAAPKNDRLNVNLPCDKCTSLDEHWYVFGLPATTALATTAINGAQLHEAGEISSDTPLLYQVETYKSFK
jgi:hypothetical protein